MYELRLCKNGNPGFSLVIGRYTTKPEREQLKLNYIWENGDLNKGAYFL